MAKSAKKPAKKAGPATLSKASAGGKSYSRGALVTHLSATLQKAGQEISKKAVAALIEEYGKVALEFARTKNGAIVVGLGKVKVRETKARPARDGINPKTGEKITIPAKAKGKKLVFRFTKDAKASI
jgi:nucleoid DNA-binding protein